MKVLPNDVDNSMMIYGETEFEKRFLGQLFEHPDKTPILEWEENQRVVKIRLKAPEVTDNGRQNDA